MGQERALRAMHGEDGGETREADRRRSGKCPRAVETKGDSRAAAAAVGRTGTRGQSLGRGGQRRDSEVRLSGERAAGSRRSFPVTAARGAARGRGVEEEGGPGSRSGGVRARLELGAALWQEQVSPRARGAQERRCELK